MKIGRYFKKLLDEKNRKADMALFHSLVAMGVSLLVTFFVLLVSLPASFKSGKVDSGLLWMLGIWMSIAFGTSTIDKFASKEPKAPLTPDLKNEAKK